MKGLLLQHADKIDTKRIMMVYEGLKDKVETEGINKGNMCSYVMILFSEVNKFKKLTEEERKDIILSILTKLIKNIDGDESKDSDMEVLLLSLVPNLVDSLMLTLNATKKLKEILCCGKV
jgi:hypothetical protein